MKIFEVEQGSPAWHACRAGVITASKPTVLRVDVNLVQVDAVVRDRAGRPMNNLRQEDFVVLEDGSERPIQFFSRDQLPLAVALVIDRSGSVAPLMNDVQNAAYQALKLLKPGDEVCLLVNDLGSTTMMELLIANRKAHDILRKMGIRVHDTQIGSYCTCQEMAGLSISLMKLDDELKAYYGVPVRSLALTRW